MMVRHSSISRLLIHSKQNQILWDFFASTQRASHYFPQTTQIYLYVVPVCRGLDLTAVYQDLDEVRCI
jgi:hypothetical protein